MGPEGPYAGMGRVRHLDVWCGQISGCYMGNGLKVSQERSGEVVRGECERPHYAPLGLLTQESPCRCPEGTALWDLSFFRGWRDEWGREGAF